MAIIETAPRWHYWLHAGTAWFESFAQHFTSPDIHMWPEDSADVPPAWFAWSSHHLDDVGTPQELVDRSASLKAVFDGALYIALGPDYHPPNLQNLTAEKPIDKSWELGLPYPGDVRVDPFSKKQIRKRVAKWRTPLEDPVARMIFLARYDDLVCAILKYTGVQGLTYMTLYAYRDWMKSGGWNDDRIAKEAGWSKAQLNDFTNTANNPAYLGPFCRHGGVGPLPKRPVTLADAEGPMRTALGKFILERATISVLAAKWAALAA
ncbi:MAG: hypothetical protein ABI395_05260 [Sphingobium sp.]